MADIHLLARYFLRFFVTLSEKSRCQSEKRSRKKKRGKESKKIEKKEKKNEENNGVKFVR